MTNAEWMVKNEYKFRDLHWSFTLPDICKFYLNDKNVGEVSSLSIFEPIKTWLDAEHVEPFRKKIKYIVKMRYDKSDFIFMRVGTTTLTMPFFDIGTMYKGMKIDKEYTLEELGL